MNQQERETADIGCSCMLGVMCFIAGATLGIAAYAGWLG